MVIFAVLPWGAQPPDKVERGHAPSAPATPRLRAKALVTTLISTGIWLAIELIVRADLISFREMAAR